MSNQSSVEILAPAGTYEAVEAAVRCGANAVYLGGKTLNARRNAGNFSFEELKAAAEYCHACGVKLHMTLNTLATDAELANDVQRAVKEACEAGIDALIIQDTGVLRVVKQCAPQMPLHASTQMSVHTLEGVKELADMGFSRAVLARELSFEEIKHITENSPIEIEVFIHGALCMSVSGQCLMSAMLGSRSANRGLCAQPCRLPFAAPNGTGSDLSLKDLSAIDYINKLAEAGVKSFKIEGRMKRPEYVAAAVKCCKNALDGAQNETLRSQLKDVFSRSGFTCGYIEGGLGREMFGTRRKEDVTAAQPVLKELKHLYEKETPRVGVELMFCAYEGEAASLSARANGKNVFVQGEAVAEKAQNVPLSREKAVQQLEKCGGTPFFIKTIETDIDDGISLPLSSINALRRSALEQLYAELKQPYKQVFTPVNVKNCVKKVNNPRFYARFQTPEQAREVCGNVEKVILPLGCVRPVEGVTAVAEIPRVFFGKEALIKEKISIIKKAGVEWACASTLDALRIAREGGMKTLLWLGSNVFNTQALNQMAEQGADEVLLSPEITLAQASHLGGQAPRGLIVYGRLPLMVTRNCPIKNGSDCSQCGGNRCLTDRLGVEFPVICGGGFSQVLNSRPIYMADRLREASFVDFNVLFFTTETPEECKQVMQKYGRGASPEGEFTRGLYYRGVE